MSEPIAVVGIAVRVPDAADSGQFWSNLVAGRESVHRLTDDQLLAAGEDARLLSDPRYVKARPLLDDVWGFDRHYFGLSERESLVANPQHRLFLELCATALQDAGYVPANFEGLIGVYGGCASDRYAEDHLRADPKLFALVGELGVDLANNPDYLTTFVSHRLGLRGPSIAVRTACSSSLVAVHLAVQALRMGDCDIALAGGVEIETPYGRGYRYVRGGVESADGHCRPLDASASGTVFGSGGGVVVLRRYADALAEGDTVLALIRGSAVNNDGAERSTFTSPSIDGQRRVICEALAAAEADPADVSYVELHGTGTPVGDPVEVRALDDAFRLMTDRELTPGGCAIGSVKSNLGHLGPAAGVVGLIKTVLALHHELIPPTINFERPNPLLELDSTPFRVAASPIPWPRRPQAPRLAGVSSFGFGGTNAHVVLEEAPERPAADGGGGPWLLVWSALDEEALADVRAGLATAVAAMPGQLPAIAYTCQTGRRALPVRAALRCDDGEEAARVLADPDAEITAASDGTSRPPALYLPAATHRADLGALLSARFPYFAERLGECLAMVDGPPDHAARVFAVEYALARSLEHLGVRPVAVAGDGVGLLAAAVVAGVLSLHDATRALSERDDGVKIIADGVSSPAAIPLLYGPGALPVDEQALHDPAFWRARLDGGDPAPDALPQHDGPVLWLDCGGDGAGGAVPVLGPPDGRSEWAGFLDTLARVWTAQGEVRWERLPGIRRRVRLPAYPYRRREYLVPRRAR